MHVVYGEEGPGGHLVNSAMYGLLVAVVERRLNQEMPADITDPVDRVAWAMFPVRDVLGDLHAELRVLRDE